MRRTFAVCFLLSIFALTSIAQSYKTDHSARFGDELNYTGASADERSVNGMIPLYDSIIYYRYSLATSDLQLYSMDKNFIYDAQNNKLSTDHYLSYNNQLYLENKSIFAYNTANQVTRNTMLNATTLDSISDRIFEYDVNGNRTLYITKTKDFDNFYINYRQVNTYDGNSNILSRTIERDLWGDSLGYQSKEVHTYENNKLSIYILMKWEQGAFVNNEKHIYSYGPNDKPSEVLIMNFATGVWADSKKNIYSYDAVGNLASRTYLSYYSGSWENKTRTSYTYVSDKKLTEVYDFWVDGEWVNVFNVFNYYDANLNMTYHECHELVEGDFVLADYERSEFDGDNIMTNNAFYWFDTWAVPSVISSGDSTIYNFRKVVGIEENDTPSPISIYPNPTRGLVRIDVSSPIIRTELYNLAGEHVITLITKSNIIDLSSQPKGVYLLKVITQKEAYVRKVMVQ